MKELNFVEIRRPKLLSQDFYGVFICSSHSPIVVIIIAHSCTLKVNDINKRHLSLWLLDGFWIRLSFPLPSLDTTTWRSDPGENVLLIPSSTIELFLVFVIASHMDIEPLVNVRQVLLCRLFLLFVIILSRLAERVEAWNLSRIFSFFPSIFDPALKDLVFVPIVAVSA